MKRNLKCYVLYAAGLVWLLTLAGGCAVQQSETRYTKDGKTYGQVEGAFRHRWWNYYERGLSFADGAFYEPAAADLKTAVQKRGRDQRMARTYGMHFMDYFPHRELGVVYYLAGDFKDARRELEISLDQFPTAKARFYLDRVRKGLMEKEGKEAGPPAITLDIKEDPFWTREDPVLITGLARDDGYVSELSVKGLPLFLDGSSRRVPFKKALSLGQGKHLVEITAKNLMGAVATRRVVIHVDREGPVIALAGLEKTGSARPFRVTLSGTAFDDAGVAGIRVAGKDIGFQGSGSVNFRESITTDGDSIEIVALDRLGNKTSAHIDLKDFSHVRRPIMVASAASGPGLLNLAGLPGSKDTRPPKIELKGWTGSQTVYMEKAYIEGKIKDESNIESLYVAGTPILKQKGRYVFFSHLAELHPGENAITIEAEDEAGNRSREEIVITRKIPKALQLAERLSLTVLPFEQKGEIPESSLFFQDGLINALVDQNRFRLIERDKLDVILQEQSLSRTKLIDKSTALRLGKLVAAKSILTGSIVETRTGIEIVARMIDTETSEILATNDVYDEAEGLPEIRELAQGMAVKFHRDFPLLGGIVVKRKGKEIFTDIGQGKITPLRRLIVYHETPVKHPVTGKILGSDNEIKGHALVNQVTPGMSKAEIISGDPASIKALDMVITE